MCKTKREGPRPTNDTYNTTGRFYVQQYICSFIVFYRLFRGDTFQLTQNQNNLLFTFKTRCQFCVRTNIVKYILSIDDPHFCVSRFKPHSIQYLYPFGINGDKSRECSSSYLLSGSLLSKDCVIVYYRHVHLDFVFCIMHRKCVYRFSAVADGAYAPIQDIELEFLFGKCAEWVLAKKDVVCSIDDRRMPDRTFRKQVEVCRYIFLQRAKNVCRWSVTPHPFSQLAIYGAAIVVPWMAARELTLRDCVRSIYRYPSISYIRVYTILLTEKWQSSFIVA